MKTNANTQTLSHYQGEGNQVIKSLDFDGERLVTGVTIVAGDVTYTSGTDFNDDLENISKEVQAVAEAINANAGRIEELHFKVIPNPRVYAKCSGAKLVVFSRVPNDDFTLSTSVSGVTATDEAASNAASDGTFSVTTAATGTNYTQLPDKSATSFRLNNDTGVALVIRKNGTSDTPEYLPDQASAEYRCRGNLNEWEVKREDNSNTQVTTTGYFER